MKENNLPKLDLIDKKILAELDKNCRIPSSQLAKIVRKSRQAVEYRIERMQKEGIITGFQTAINPHKIGYSIYKIYLRLRNNSEQKEKILKYLRSSPIVYWMGEFSGSWDLIFAVFVRSNYEFFEMKNDLISKFGKYILEDYGDLLLDVKQYPKMYFTHKITEPSMFAGEVVYNKLDKIDYEILAIIVNDARISLVELAYKLKSTPMIVKHRMKKMEKFGVIIQYRLAVDLNKLGLELYKVIIKLDRCTKDDEKKLLNYISNLPNINYFIRNLWQIEPELVFENYQEYYKEIEKMKGEFSEIIRSVDPVLMISDEWTPGFKNLLKVK